MLRRWSEREDDVVRELYPLHGRDWDGWPRVLPGRGGTSVANRAQKLGVRVNPDVVYQRRVEAGRLSRTRWLERPREGADAVPEATCRRVRGLLAQGLAPSEIDARLGLGPGTSRRAVTQGWRDGTPM